MMSFIDELTASLDSFQVSAIHAFEAGKSIAILGGAGSGKSHLLHKLIALAEKRYGKYPEVAVCALTNKAANALQGTTIHSLFGAKPSWEFSKEFLWEGIQNRPKLLNRLRKIKLLVIDEISLLRANEMDAIDHVLRQLADTELNAGLPFGGRTVVLAGDPFQLEPYEEVNSVQIESRETSVQSRSWYLTFGSLGDGVTVVLRHNHRQSIDQAFFDMLNRIRTGAHSGEDLSLLNSSSDGKPHPPETHTRLFPTNAQVAEINRSVLSKIPGDEVTFSARDSFEIQKSSSLEARLSTVAPKEVSIKVGARVILTRKIRDVVPGTQGIVQRITDFTKTRKYPRYLVDIKIVSLQGDKNAGRNVTVGAVSFDVHGYNRQVIASREQLPIIPPYAMTIHRSQGMTMEHVAIDFSAVNKWRPVGLVYVALSRCRTFSGLWVKNLKDRHIRVSSRAFQLLSDIWSLKRYHPERVHGVYCRLDLGLDDGLDVESISDDSSDDESLFICENIKTIDLTKPEQGTQTKSPGKLPRKRSMVQPIVAGKRRCLIWESKGVQAYGM